MRWARYGERSFGCGVERQLGDGEICHIVGEVDPPARRTSTRTFDGEAAVRGDFALLLIDGALGRCRSRSGDRYEESAVASAASAIPARITTKVPAAA
jgi:hypothetical protein